jgi:hypothetical protein
MPTRLPLIATRPLSGVVGVQAFPDSAVLHSGYITDPVLQSVSLHAIVLICVHINTIEVQHVSVNHHDDTPGTGA